MNSIDGDYITALGANAGTDSGIVRNNIYIGDPGFGGDENLISIGGISASGTDYTDTYIGGIYGASVNVSTAAAVYVDTDGHLGTVLVGASGKPAAPRVRRGKAAQPQAMLNRKVEKLQVTTAQQQKQIGQQQKQIEVLTAQLKEQSAQIQKVSAQLEVSKPAPQVRYEQTVKLRIKTALCVRSTEAKWKGVRPNGERLLFNDCFLAQ
jgi:hypothetical protein